MGTLFGKTTSKHGQVGGPGQLGPTVITGAASGIGRALAENLADSRRVLLLTDRDEAGLVGLASYLSSGTSGAEVHTATLDITDHGAVEKWANAAVEAHGAPQEIYHIAGVAIWGDPVTLPVEKWRRVIDINLMGTVNVVTAFLPAMTAAGRPGRIVCTSSAAGIIGLPWHAAYSASKAGVIGMCEVLRFDLRKQRIDVHVLVPGAVNTPLVQTVDLHGVDRSKPRVKKATALFQRGGSSPEYVAQRVLKQAAKGRFLITTSAEVNLARTAQLLAPGVYVRVMRTANWLARWATS